MSDPESNGCESDSSEEVSCEFVVSCGDTSEMFDLVEEAFDEVALFVDLRIDGALGFAVFLGRDVGLGAMACDELDDGLGVVAAISDGIVGRPERVDQGRHSGFVGCLAWCQEQADRQALAVDHRVDLGAQSSTRTADGVIRTPFFPPAACWWARTIEESIR